MRRALQAIGIAAMLLALLPAAAHAQQRGRGSQHRVHGQHPQPHHRFHQRPFGSRLIVVGPLVPFGYFSAPTVVYSAPPIYYAPPPVAYPSPAAYGPPPAYAAPPAPAYAPPPQQEIDPIHREVVFPTGRYVLRGDGITTPYTWVWIPNPPAAPSGAARISPRAVERVVYAWTDADGVTTWTDRLSKVPPEHRANARREF